MLGTAGYAAPGGSALAVLVLVHPAWFGGWCWKKLVPLLTEYGHSVHTPTLTGLGERSHLAHPGIVLQTHPPARTRGGVFSNWRATTCLT